MVWWLLRLTCCTVLALFLGMVGASGALAAVSQTPGAGWSISSVATPTNFAPGASNENYQVFAVNAGGVATSGPVTITDKLPTGFHLEKTNLFELPGETENGRNGSAPLYPMDSLGDRLLVGAVRLPEIAGTIAGVGENPDIVDLVWSFPCVVNGAATEVSCTYDHGPVNPGITLEVTVGVEVPADAKEGEEVVNTATVSGGGALPASTSGEPNPISSAKAGYGLESFNFEAAGIDGLTDTQAGDHPYGTTVSYYLNNEHTKGEGLQGAERAPYGTYTPASNDLGVKEYTKDFVVDLPPGLVGNPQVVPKCKSQQVIEEACPPASQVGVATLYIVGGIGQTRVRPVIDPIYNVVPEANEPADFQFMANGEVPVNLAVTVSQETGYAVRVIVSGVPKEGEITGTSVTFFGTPDTDRNVFDKSTGASSVAFLGNPVDCQAGPLTARVSTDSWENPGKWTASGAPELNDPAWKSKTVSVYPEITGCDALQFNPSVSLIPDTTQADEPTGVSVDVHVPQAPDQFPDVATPELKDATVTLPEGMSLSPSAADGLQACSNEEIALDSGEPSSCPNGSVLGTVKVFTPLLERPLEGQVFLGEPECDPCSSVDAADGKQLRIYIEAYGSGVRVKREGRVYANPSTGQLTTRFEANPELPFEDLELHFSGGLRAGLATPQACGQATTTADFSAWSSPVTPDAIPTNSFNVDWDGNGGACPSSMPFTPSFSAGTSNPNAGQFSPFTLTFGREDREQDLAGIQVHMPEGLLGILSGIALCSEPQASQGACSEASRIGTMTVAAGPGAHPFYEKGSIYLTESYHGAPFGLSIVVPTIAGPFNLGNVVVRAKIDVDPTTTALTVTSDPFPQVIDGIPLRLRAANVTIDRPGFIFNPTDCEKLAIAATVASAQGAQANVSAPFAVAGCAGLPFGPKFKVSTSARTSRADGASLDARLIYPSGAQSNIAHVKVELPKALPSRLTTLQKACPAATFDANPAACPSGSIVGVARAVSPVLPVPLSGPAYFVSHGGEEFPNLIVVLQGYGVRLDLVGDTFINKNGITSSTFSNVPDVQVDSFELYLPEGPDSALAANGNLCKQKLVMPATFTAQDGAQLKQNTKIEVTGCPKTKAKKAKASRRVKARARRARARRARARRARARARAVGAARRADVIARRRNGKGRGK